MHTSQKKVFQMEFSNVCILKKNMFIICEKQMISSQKKCVDWDQTEVTGHRKFILIGYVQAKVPVTVHRKKTSFACGQTEVSVYHLDWLKQTGNKIVYRSIS